MQSFVVTWSNKFLRSCLGKVKLQRWFKHELYSASFMLRKQLRIWDPVEKCCDRASGVKQAAFHRQAETRMIWRSEFNQSDESRSRTCICISYWSCTLWMRCTSYIYSRTMLIYHELCISLCCCDLFWNIYLSICKTIDVYMHAHVWISANRYCNHHWAKILSLPLAKQMQSSVRRYTSLMNKE